MLSPPTWIAPSTRAPLPMGRREAKAARKRVQANVISQCDGCGATDDAEHRIGRERHQDCGGTFRLFGVTG